MIDHGNCQIYNIYHTYTGTTQTNPELGRYTWSGVEHDRSLTLHQQQTFTMSERTRACMCRN